MSRIDQVYVVAITLSLVVMLIAISYCIHQDRNRIGVLEIRLQNVEHLLSLSLSESRSSVLTNRTDRVPAFTDEIR